ncbi:MAG: hypothetical protein M3Y77_04875 [Actinomycetota bacterium]|nr:hypothetical protein [Actinomycetota bacterium]
MTNPIHVDGVPELCLVFMTTRFSSFADVHRIAPEEPVCTMGVLGSYEDPRHYAENDSFVCAGLVKEWHIRKWANISGWQYR